MDSLRGHLLVSGPSLWDPNFRRTVVLIGHHDDEGAVGVVLNQPLEATVEEAAPPLSPLVPTGDPLFRGGPVQPESAVVLADFVDPGRAGVLALDSIGFLPEESDADSLGGLRRARVFAGYAGWGAGQLEAEIAGDSWHSTPAQPGDVFTDDPEGLWTSAVRRLGPGFRLLATMPLDPNLN
ncbi:MAG: YqgE/AlgH family protein [Actinomycetota bacterium]